MVEDLGYGDWRSLELTIRTTPWPADNPAAESGT